MGITFVNFPWAALVALIVAIVSAIVGIVVFAFKAGKIVYFVEKMESNHLPHIQKALYKIAHKLDVDIHEQKMEPDCSIDTGYCTGN